MKRVPGLTPRAVGKMTRAEVFGVILGPDWAEDEHGVPKFLADLKAARKAAPAADPHRKTRDRLVLMGLPDWRIDEVIAEISTRMDRSRQALYDLAGVKKRPF